MHQSKDYIKRNLRLSRAQKCIPLVGAISTLTCAGPQTTPTHVRQYRAENGILGKSGVPFAMVQCLHQSNDYMKRTLGLWRAQKCISLVGAISALTCAGVQTATRTEYWENPTVPFAMVQCLHQSSDYIKKKLVLWRAQKCIPLIGAISVVTCAGPQTTQTHVRQYRADNRI